MICYVFRIMHLVIQGMNSPQPFNNSKLIFNNTRHGRRRKPKGSPKPIRDIIMKAVLFIILNIHRKLKLQLSPHQTHLRLIV